MTFKEFMQEIDDKLVDETGLGYMDFPDRNFRLDYEAGIDTDDVVNDMLEDEGYYTDEKIIHKFTI